MAERMDWDARYRESFTPWDSGVPSSELEAFLDAHPALSGSALEFGCGYGTNAIYLAGRGFLVTAFDLSPTAIAGAQRRAADAGVTVDFRVADLTSQPDLGGPFDFLFDRGVYHCIRRQGDLDAYLDLLGKVSRPGTLFLCLAGNSREESDPGPPTVSEEELRGELGQFFEIVDLHEFRFDLSPGVPTRPLGWSALLRRV